jgi:hypothetical protein
MIDIGIIDGMSKVAISKDIISRAAAARGVTPSFLKKLVSETTPSSRLYGLVGKRPSVYDRGGILAERARQISRYGGSQDSDRFLAKNYISRSADARMRHMESLREIKRYAPDRISDYHNLINPFKKRWNQG